MKTKGERDFMYKPVTEMKREDMANITLFTNAQRMEPLREKIQEVLGKDPRFPKKGKAL